MGFCNARNNYGSTDKMDQSMTVQEALSLQPGDIITIYNRGYFKFSHLTPEILSESDLPLTNACMLYNGQADWKVGDIYGYLIHYTKIFDSNMKPINGNKVKCLNMIYCEKVTLSDILKKIEDVTADHQTILSNYQKLITLL